MQLTYFINFAVFLFPALSLVMHQGYSFGPVLLGILGLPFLFLPSSYYLDKKVKYILIAFVLYFFSFVLSFLIEPAGNPRSLDTPARALLACIIVILLCRYRFKFYYFALGCGVGAIGAGCVAIYERFALGYERAFIDRQAIISGDISMSLSLISLCFLMYSLHNRCSKGTAFFAISAFMAFIGSVLSGSRGGWVFVPIILLVFFVIYRELLIANIKYYILAGIAVVVLVIAIPQTNVAHRLSLIGHDIQLYTNGTNLDTSIGQRFQMWKSAAISISEKPILGWGEYGIYDSKKIQLEKGQITPIIYKRLTTHNQFLDAWAKNGLFGLFCLLAIFWLPLKVFRHILLNNPTWEEKTIAAIGCLVILSTIDFSLTFTFLIYSAGSIYYFSMIALCIGYLFSRDKK